MAAWLLWLTRSSRERRQRSLRAPFDSRWQPAADRRQALPGNPEGQRRPRAGQQWLVVRRARGGWQCQAVQHGPPASANSPRPRHGPLDRRAAVITAIVVTVDIVARRGAAGMSERPAQSVRRTDQCRFVDDEKGNGCCFCEGGSSEPTANSQWKESYSESLILIK